MKKSFTLLEIIIVLILSGIFGIIIVNLISNTSKRYMIDYQYNLLDIETDNYINKLNNLFNNIIPNTVIGDKCEIKNNNCYNGNYSSFDNLKNITDKQENNKYPVIEFYKENNYINFYKWNNDKNQNIPLSSKFVDLSDTKIINSANNQYNITVVDSNISSVFDTLNNYLTDNGIKENSSENNNTVLLMSGPFDNGAISDINNSYGYDNTKAIKLFGISSYKHQGGSSNVYNNKDILNIEPIDNLKGIKTQPYQSFFIINTAYALVPKINKYGLENIYLFKFYKPWKGQKYINAESKTLFMTNLSTFIVKNINNSFFIKICKSYPQGKEITNDVNFTVCKQFFKY